MWMRTAMVEIEVNQFFVCCDAVHTEPGKGGAHCLHNEDAKHEQIEIRFYLFWLALDGSLFWLGDLCP